LNKFFWSFKSHPMFKRIFALPAISFLLLISLFCQGQIDRDFLLHRIERLHEVPNRSLLDSMYFLTETFEQLPVEDAKTYTERMLPILKKRNTEYYLLLISFYSKFAGPMRYKTLDEGIAIAIEKNLEQVEGILCISKSERFKEDRVYDSSMFYLLKARDLFEKSDNIAGLVDALHLLGDLYYASGLYDTAEKYYREIMRRKGDLYQWNKWRADVIHDNLGLIEKQRGNYTEAARYFNKTLQQLAYPYQTLRDSMMGAYLESELADIYLKAKEFEKSKAHLARGLDIAHKLSLYSELALFLAVKSELHLEENKPAEALMALKEAEELFLSNQLKEPETEVRVMYLLSRVFLQLQHFEAAETYLKKYVQMNDFLIREETEKAHINIHTNHEYNQLANKLLLANFQKRYLLAYLIGGTLAAFVLIMSLLRIKKKNKDLVAKNLAYFELFENRNTQSPSTAELKDLNNNTDADALLFEKFEKYLRSGKPFINAEFTISIAADALSTNRSYLSKSINNFSAVNFSTYIRKILINEAIKMINSGALKELSLEGIGKKVGYNSRTSFINAFKEQTGVSPSVFVKNMPHPEHRSAKKHLQEEADSGS
jgi:YesN/AraC family two-component response regulator